MQFHVTLSGDIAKSLARLKALDQPGRQWQCFDPGRVIGITPDPYPCIHAFGAQFAVLAGTVPDVEARLAQFEDRRLDLENVPDRGRHQELAGEVDCRKTGGAE